MLEKDQCKGRIRLMTEQDLDLVFQWRNHPDVRMFMYTQHEIAFEEHKRWFENCSRDENKHLLIYEIDGNPLGFVNFSQLSLRKIADWGFYVAPGAPKGTGRQLGATALDYAFCTLDLHKLCGQALLFNEPSIGFHKSLGFQQEGVLRDHHFDGKKYYSIVCFGLLSCEWSSNQG